MWNTEYTVETDVPADALWSALRDLHTGTPIGPSSDTFDIQGPFAVGTEILVTPQGQDTFRSTIVELEENRRYADRTEFGELTLLFRHTLDPVGSGTRVTHRLEIDGAQADAMGPEIGPSISEDFPVAMDELIAAGRRVAAS